MINKLESILPHKDLNKDLNLKLANSYCESFDIQLDLDIELSLIGLCIKRASYYSRDISNISHVEPS